MVVVLMAKKRGRRITYVSLLLSAASGKIRYGYDTCL